MSLTNAVDFTLVTYHYQIIAPEHRLDEEAQVRFDALGKERYADMPEFILVNPKHLPTMEHWAEDPVMAGAKAWHRAQLHDMAVLVETTYYVPDQEIEFRAALLEATNSHEMTRFGVLVEAKKDADLESVLKSVLDSLSGDNKFHRKDYLFDWGDLKCGLSDQRRGSVWVCVYTEGQQEKAADLMLGEVTRLRRSEVKLRQFGLDWSAHQAELDEKRSALREIVKQTSRPGALPLLESHLGELSSALQEIRPLLHIGQRLLVSSRINLEGIRRTIAVPDVPEESRRALEYGLVLPLDQIIFGLEDSLEYANADIEAAKMQLDAVGVQANLESGRWSRYSTNFLALFAAAGVVQVVMENLPGFGPPSGTQRALIGLASDGKFWSKLIFMLALWVLAYLVLHWLAHKHRKGERMLLNEEAGTKASRLKMVTPSREVSLHRCRQLSQQDNEVRTN